MTGTVWATWRDRMVLLAADGMPNAQIARTVGRRGRMTSAWEFKMGSRRIRTENPDFFSDGPDQRGFERLLTRRHRRRHAAGARSSRPLCCIVASAISGV